MDALWRGLKGAMVGVGIAGMIAVARPVLWIGLALAALAGFLVGGIGGVVGCLPRKGLRMLKRIAIVAGCAMLASLFAVMAFRTWSMETPDLPYVPPILAGLLGGVIVLLHETGAKALSKADVDSKNHAKATKHNNRISKSTAFGGGFASLRGFWQQA